MANLHIDSKKLTTDCKNMYWYYLSEEEQLEYLKKCVNYGIEKNIVTYDGYTTQPQELTIKFVGSFNTLVNNDRITKLYISKIVYQMYYNVAQKIKEIYHPLELIETPLLDWDGPIIQYYKEADCILPTDQHNYEKQTLAVGIYNNNDQFVRLGAI